MRLLLENVILITFVNSTKAKFNNYRKVPKVTTSQK